MGRTGGGGEGLRPNDLSLAGRRIVGLYCETVDGGTCSAVRRTGRGQFLGDVFRKESALVPSHSLLLSRGVWWRRDHFRGAGDYDTRSRIIRCSESLRAATREIVSDARTPLHGVGGADGGFACSLWARRGSSGRGGGGARLHLGPVALHSSSAARSTRPACETIPSLPFSRRRGSATSCTAPLAGRRRSGSLSVGSLARPLEPDMLTSKPVPAAPPRGLGIEPAAQRRPLCAVHPAHTASLHRTAETSWHLHHFGSLRPARDLARRTAEQAPPGGVSGPPARTEARPLGSAQHRPAAPLAGESRLCRSDAGRRHSRPFPSRSRTRDLR